MPLIGTAAYRSGHGAECAPNVLSRTEDRCKAVWPILVSQVSSYEYVPPVQNHQVASLHELFPVAVGAYHHRRLYPLGVLATDLIDWDSPERFEDLFGGTWRERPKYPPGESRGDLHKTILQYSPTTDERPHMPRRVRPAAVTSLGVAKIESRSRRGRWGHGIQELPEV